MLDPALILDPIWMRVSHFGFSSRFRGWLDARHGLFDLEGEVFQVMEADVTPSS